MPLSADKAHLEHLLNQPQMVPGRQTENWLESIWCAVRAKAPPESLALFRNSSLSRCIGEISRVDAFDLMVTADDKGALFAAMSTLLVHRLAYLDTRLHRLIELVVAC